MTMSLYFNLSFRLGVKSEGDTRANLVQIRPKNMCLYSDFIFLSLVYNLKYFEL